MEILPIYPCTDCRNCRRFADLLKAVSRLSVSLPGSLTAIEALVLRFQRISGLRKVVVPHSGIYSSSLKKGLNGSPSTEEKA